MFELQQFFRAFSCFLVAFPGFLTLNVSKSGKACSLCFFLSLFHVLA